MELNFCFLLRSVYDCYSCWVNLHFLLFGAGRKNAKREGMSIFAYVCFFVVLKVAETAVVCILDWMKMSDLSFPSFPSYFLKDSNKLMGNTKISIKFHS